MSQSAIIPLQVALDGLIQGDGTIAGMLGGAKVYSLRAPEDDAVFAGGKGYIVLGQSVETTQPNFDGPAAWGDNGIETITVWSDDVSKKTVGDIAAELKRLLNGTDLVVAGRYFCSGNFNIVVLDLDQSGKYSFASCRYEVLTYAR